MKTLQKLGLMAMAVMVGATGFAGAASADDHRGYRDDHREPVKVVVVHKKPMPLRRDGLFDRMDINNDGQVSRWEFQQRYGSKRAAMRTFNRVDVNESGKLTAREVARGAGMIRELHMRG